ncbi:MAG: protein translocase subunit SecD, partial [Kiritimatiellaeota bacterium]|nr:protein translocase subunit SecD [Kiritimatiellota bacterium]
MKSTSMIWKWLVLAILATVSVYVVTTPPGGGKAPGDEDAEKKLLPGVRVGIDIGGGASFTVAVDEERLRADIADENPAFDAAQLNAEYNKRVDGALGRVLDILRRRVDNMGVNEPVIYKRKSTITIQLPGASEAQRKDAEKQIESAAFLEFRLLHKDNASLVEKIIGKPFEGFAAGDDGAGWVKTPAYDALERDPDYRRRLARYGCEGLSTYSMMLQRGKGGKGEVFTPAIVSNRRELTGERLKSASTEQDPTLGEIAVSLVFDSEGARTFRQVTRNNVNRQLAIILDGILYSSPNINEEIAGGKARISGRFSVPEANALRNVLNAGALPIPVKIVEKRVIDPTLGKDAIQSGLYAAAGGALAVFLFMLVYYFYCGLIANIALALDLLLLPATMIVAAGFLSFFDSSVDSRLLALPVFTMPGIAGIVLTIGMAVDANILIFERIREEFRLGKSARAAVAAGYDRAFLAILDSNLTTLLSAVILFIVGTGPIKGFAITLTAGIMISMFTVLVVTRMVFDLTVPEGRVKPYKMLSVVGENLAFDFLGRAKPAMAAVGVFIVASLLVFGARMVKNPAVLFSVDLSGGTITEFKHTREVPRADIDAALKEAGVLDAEIQYQGMGEGRVLVVRTSVVSADDTQNPVEQRVGAALSDAFPDAGFELKASDTIGSSVGAEMRTAAVWAVLLAP